MIEYYSRDKSTGHLNETDSFIKGGWINAINPTNEEIEYLVNIFGVTESNIIDGLDIHENPRFELDAKKVYIYLTAPTNKIKHEHDSSFLIIYSKDFFMTVSKYSLEIFEKILKSNVKLEKFEHSRNIVKILFMISRLFEKSVQKIIKETKENKADLSKLKSKDIELLINYEDKLTSYLSSFSSTISTYQRIIRDESINLIKKDEEIIEDLIIDLNETINLCKQTLGTISNMRNYYSAKLSNDLNKTVTVLTIVTIFLSIPTLISSIYGMNIPLPFQNSSGTLVVLVLISIFICVSFILILKRKKII